MQYNSSPPGAAYMSVNWVNIASGNGLSPVRRQTITWTNTDLLSIGPLGINFSEIQIKIYDFSFTKMHLKMLSEKWRPFCPRGDEIIYRIRSHEICTSLLNFVLILLYHFWWWMTGCTWFIYPFCSGLLHWHWGNCVMSVQVTWPWRSPGIKTTHTKPQKYA